jgi:hypothetical protein
LQQTSKRNHYELALNFKPFDSFDFMTEFMVASSSSRSVDGYLVEFNEIIKLLPDFTPSFQI